MPPRGRQRPSLSSLVNAVGEHSVVDRPTDASAGNAPTERGGAGGPVVIRAHASEIAANPRNPRKHLGDLEDLADIRTVQYQTALTVTRDAYLALWPEDADKVGDVRWVIAAGDRRRAAAQQYDTLLEFVVKDEVAATKASFMAASLGENIRRKNLDPIDEARGVDDLAKELGSGEAAAAALDKSTAWVSNVRNLLKLVPELQDKYRAGDLAIRDARKIWSADAAEQMVRWRLLMEEQEEERDAKRRETLAARKAQKAEQEPEPIEPDPAAVRKDPARMLELQVKAVRKLFNRTKVDAPTVATAVLDEYGEDGYKAIIAKWEERHR